MIIPLITKDDIERKITLLASQLPLPEGRGSKSDL